LKQNYIFNNPYEVMHLLQQDWGIEYKSISEHFFIVKNKQKVLIQTPTLLKNYFSAREPPGLKGEVSREYSLKIGTN
jgi:hypothetical protein